ncbi:uncharacterized protein BN697_02411 [Bacteroides sp. CAG:530]|nr:uncharacterized protein BN697_02411 [Bacteroides sp. CAG:530]
MKLYIKLLFILCVCSVFVGCSKDDEQTERSGFVISLDEATVDVASRATPKELGKPLDVNFSIKVVNTATGSSVYDGAFTKLIPVNAGSYELTASYGEDVELEFDTPYYIGKVTAEHQKNVNTPVSIPCRVGNALLSVVFENASAFNQLYKKYGLRVDVGESSKTIGGDETAKSLYFKAGSDVKIYFDATKKDNSPYSVDLTAGLASVLPFKAADHAVVKLTTSAFGLKIEKIEVEKVTVSETIPVEWLPKPKVSGFEDITYVETDDAPQNAVIDYTASLPIQDMELTLNMQDEQYSVYNKTYTLSTLTSNDRANLGKLGIELPEVGVAKTGTINLQNLIGTMQTNAGATVDNTFSLRVKANNRWSDETAAAKTYKVEVVKPEFSVKVDERNCWSREFTVDEVSITSGNAERLKENLVYQYYNGSEWVDCADRNNTKGRLQQFASRAEDISTKQYKVRALYRGAISSNEVTATLETPAQLPNSDMEEWQSVKLGRTSIFGGRADFYDFLPYKSGESDIWWATKNERSRDYSVSRIKITSAPCVSYTDDPSIVHGGNKSAFIYTSGHGGTYASTIDIIYPEGAFAGSLFIGKYKWSDNTEQLNPGHAFSKRPTSLVFWYKYIPKNTDSFKVYAELKNGNDIIASGTYIPAAISSETEWVKIELPLVYVDTPNVATDIFVQFLSTEKTSFVASDFDKKKKVSFPNMPNWEVHMGSRLYIDDISLVYDK